MASLTVSKQGPEILLSGHLKGDLPILVYRVGNYVDSVERLKAEGKDVRELEIPHGPCASFRAPGGQRMAIYELTRPDAANHFQGRIDD